MDSIGETIRKIRLSKGLTLKDVAINQLSPAFLSKVERNESDISMRRFEIILTQLHVTYDEFQFLRNDYALNPQDNFSQKISLYIRNDNVYGLQSLCEQEKLKIPKKNYIYSRHFHNMTLAKFHIARIKHQPLPKKEVDNIRTFLITVDSWGLYELRLFNNTMFIFDDSAFITLVKRSLDKVILYLDLPGFTDVLSNVLGNAIQLLIERGHISISLKLLKKFKQSINFEKLSIGNSKLLLLDLLLTTDESNLSINLNSAHAIIQACYQLGAINWANSLNNYLTDWINQNFPDSQQSII